MSEARVGGSLLKTACRSNLRFITLTGAWNTDTYLTHSLVYGNQKRKDFHLNGPFIFRAK